MSTPPCPICDDMGIVPANTTHNPTNRARDCECRERKRIDAAIKSARIPPRYEYASLKNYGTDFPGVLPEQKAALLAAQSYVRDYPTLDAKGLLIYGSLGTGKTHLAVGIMRVLIAKYGLKCHFVDQLVLLQELKDTFDSNITTKQVLAPLLTCDVLVIDDLGAAQLSDWAANTVALLLTSRYNNNLTTIATTNFPVKFTMKGDDPPVAQMTDKQMVERSTAETVLGDRITNRVLSRLLESCAEIHVPGKDFRATIKKAHW
jgi:DNA replication protein DnaC